MQGAPGRFERQYDLERTYHGLLMAESDPARRLALYREAYSRLYAEFLDGDPKRDAFGWKPYHAAMLRPIARGRTVVDLGCGLGAGATDLARFARRVIGFEVDPSIVERAARRAGALGARNVEFRALRDGRMDMDDESVDAVISVDVAEHLHPEDFAALLAESFAALKQGGWMVVVTPHRSTGPHDISQYFLPRGAAAQGLHLREYDFGSLAGALRSAGFRRIATAGISPRILARWGAAGLTRWLLRPVGWTEALERSPLRKSGLCSGALELATIVMAGRK